MRLLSFLLLIIAIGFYSCTTSTATGVKTNSSQSDVNKKILVELFTSQGCSSCPSADQLVSNLAATDTNLIVLSFHVDYWDRLGWKDVFSNHAYTLRQQQYVQALHAESAYTPQAVVQGEYEMVGSNKMGITNALNRIRQQNDEEILTANATISNHNIDLHYEVNKNSPHQQLFAALVQTHASTAIQRGENSGVRLEGYNVVRSLQAVALTQKNGGLKITLPSDIVKENASLVVFVQDVSSQKIIAVAEVKI